MHKIVSPSDERQTGAEIEVTRQMIEAGLDELRQHYYAGDATCMVEEVYRAMAYAARASASTNSASR